MVTRRSVWPIVQIVRLTAVSMPFDIRLKGVVPLFERSLFSMRTVLYPTTSLHPVPVIILHRGEIQVMIRWSQTVRQIKTSNLNYSRYEVSEMLAAYQLRKKS